MTDQPWLVWMWQHYALDVSAHDTFEEAVSYAEGIQDAGDGSLECIEGPEGVVPAFDVDTETARQRVIARAHAATAPTYTHVIELLSPGSPPTPAQWEWYTTEAEAQAAYEPLRARFGERVNLRVL